MIFDRIWGDCEFDKLYFKFIDTYEFQRMRNMKQLGNSYYIFSSASGNRFEHSIGVGYIANYFAKLLQMKFPKIVTDQHVKLLTIAGLVHDIGHGPFSHVFDGMFGKEYNHESRSMLILRRMCLKYMIPLKPNELTIIEYIISPPEDKKDFWLFQIISGDIDVDRMDYILRDSSNVGCSINFNKDQAYKILNEAYIDKDNKLIFPNSYDFLDSRKKLYDNVYHHPTVKKLDKIIINLFKYAKLDEISMDIDEFIKLDDTILFKLYHDPNCKKIVKKFLNRDF